MRLEEWMAAPLRSYRFRQWDREGAPSTALRWGMAHPIAVTVGIAVVLGAVFGVTFGVPPVSPFVLVVVLCAPILPWLRSQGRLYREWLDRDPDAEGGGGSDAGTPDGTPERSPDGTPDDPAADPRPDHEASDPPGPDRRPGSAQGHDTDPAPGRQSGQRGNGWPRTEAQDPQRH